MSDIVIYEDNDLMRALLQEWLSKAGYRTAALDTRGYNLSDKPQGVAAYAMPNLIGESQSTALAQMTALGLRNDLEWTPCPGSDETRPAASPRRRSR